MRSGMAAGCLRPVAGRSVGVVRVRVASGRCCGTAVGGDVPRPDAGEAMMDKITELVDQPRAADYRAIKFGGGSFAIVVALTLAFLALFF